MAQKAPVLLFFFFFFFFFFLICFPSSLTHFYVICDGFSLVFLFFSSFPFTFFFSLLLTSCGIYIKEKNKNN